MNEHGDSSQMKLLWRVAIACGTVLWLSAGPAAADDLPGVSARNPAWEVTERNEDPDRGYVLYTRALVDSDFTAYRLEAVIDAPPSEVAAAARRNVVDPDKTGANTEKTILRSEGDVTYVYSYIDLPMMVSDRDVVTRAERFYDAVTGIYKVMWTAISGEGPAPKRGVVRLTKSSGSWEFSPLGEDQTRAIYENHTDIGGMIPTWIINPLMNGQVTQSLLDLYDTIEQNRRRGG